MVVMARYSKLVMQEGLMAQKQLRLSCAMHRMKKYNLMKVLHFALQNAGQVNKFDNRPCHLRMKRCYQGCRGPASLMLTNVGLWSRCCVVPDK